MNVVPLPHTGFDLRLVPLSPAPRRRLSVRINVIDGRSPFGRTRILMLRESDIDELIAVAARMERRA
jgi:hypothetical protein